MQFPLPDKIFDTHTFVSGKTGAGKSFTIAGMIERLFALRRRVCVVDPKGDYWGLGYAADGKGPGLPIYLFGDFKTKSKVADVPLNARLGKEVARLVAESDASYVLGFRGWTVADMTAFYIDFTTTLFNVVDAPLNLFIDEMQNFAPKSKIMSPQAAMCLHMSNKILSEGRGIGLNIGIASQRPQKVHNDTLDCAETLIAMRSVHPRARLAIKEWMEGQGDPEKSKEILESLAGMKRGEAFVWSPENEFMDRVQFPMVKTYDSYKAPTHKDRPVALKARAEINLEKIKEKFAATIEEAKANDPRELKRQIAELKREVTLKMPASFEAPHLQVHIDRALAKERQRTERILSDLKRQHEYILKPYKALVTTIQTQMKNLGETPVLVLPEIKPVGNAAEPPQLVDRNFALVLPPRKRIAEHDPDVKIGAGARRMLGVILQFHPNGVPEGQMRSLAGLKKSGTFTTYKSQLRMAGLVEERGGLFLATDVAVAEYGHTAQAAPSSTREVIDLWGKRLGAGARRMLEVLVNAGGNFVDEASLLEAAQLSKSGTFTTYKSQLRTANLIVTEGSSLAANKETLFL